MGLKIMIIRVVCAMHDAMSDPRIKMYRTGIDLYRAGIDMYRTGIDLSSGYISGHFFRRGPILSPP